MKTIMLLTTTLFLFSCAPVLGAELYDAQGRKVAELRDGKVFDRNGRRVGTIEEDGTVKNARGQRLGRWEKDGDLRNNDGELLGRIEEGKVYNKQRQRVGELRDGQ